MNKINMSNTDQYTGITSGYASWNTENKSNLIEQLVKALGTMVLIPTEISDPNNIGKKIQGAPVQRPILEGDKREKVLNKLVEIITE